MSKRLCWTSNVKQTKNTPQPSTHLHKLVNRLSVPLLKAIFPLKPLSLKKKLSPHSQYMYFYKLHMCLLLEIFLLNINKAYSVSYFKTDAPPWSCCLWKANPRLSPSRTGMKGSSFLQAKANELQYGREVHLALPLEVGGKKTMPNINFVSRKQQLFLEALRELRTKSLPCKLPRCRHDHSGCQASGPCIMNISQSRGLLSFLTSLE